MNRNVCLCMGQWESLEICVRSLGEGTLKDEVGCGFYELQMCILHILYISIAFRITRLSEGKNEVGLVVKKQLDYIFL